MPKVHVLVGEGNQVIGTFSPGAVGGRAAPEQAGFVAGPGQRIIELDLADSVLRLDPDSLHQKIKADHLR